MNDRQPPRRAPGVTGMLLMLFVVVGLLFMHGVQSSVDPTDIRGVPLMSSVAMSAPDGHSDRHSAGHSCQCDGHRHPGGQMCLALLALGSLLLFGALLVRSAPGRTTPTGPVAPGRGRPGRPPPAPSIFQLSVLRL
ncbi:DUF6153 family protein [Actinoallomurus acaciae]|uniref:DUF6153 family protein n=1 Tax=Actinoallomurus acaciae TaxID=502577 RepID=A0ABV5YLU3_9ACTN